MGRVVPLGPRMVTLLGKQWGLSKGGLRRVQRHHACSFKGYCQKIIGHQDEPTRALIITQELCSELQIEIAVLQFADSSRNVLLHFYGAVSLSECSKSVNSKRANRNCQVGLARCPPSLFIQPSCWFALVWFRRDFNSDRMDVETKKRH